MGGRSLDDEGPIRAEYITSLNEADDQRYERLIRFVGSDLTTTT